MSKIENGLNYVGIIHTTTASTTTQQYVFMKIDVGSWNMDTTDTKSVAHGLSSTEWKTITNLNGIIFRDDLLNSRMISGGSKAGWTVGVDEPADCFIWNIGSTNITLSRKIGGGFDNNNFDSTGINRGFISFYYKQDS